MKELGGRLRGGGTGRLAVLAALAGAVAGCGSGERKTLKVSYGESAPMMYRDAKGEAAGFAVDVLREAARRKKIRLEWVAASGRPAEEVLQTGEADLLTAGIPTEERKARFYVSEPWWEMELIAVTLWARGPEREEDLRGLRLAAPPAGRRLVEEYRPRALIAAGSATDAAEKVCLGEADAAVMGEVYEREILRTKPAPCRGVSLRVIDLQRTLKISVIGRREVAKEAAELREAIDGITLDGTLMRIAAHHQPASLPNAERAARLLQAEHEWAVWQLVLGTLVVLLAVSGSFLLRLQRSREALREANAMLVKAGAVREEAVRALTSSEERFRRLADTAFDWIWEVDTEWRYTFVGPQVRELLGYGPEEVLGRTPFELMKGEEAERVRAELAEIARERRPFQNLENALVHKGGGEVVVETSGAPRFGAAGEFLGYSGADRDVTAQRKKAGLKALEESVHEVMAAGCGAQERMRRVLEALGRAGGWETGWAWRWDGWSGRLTEIGRWGSRDGEQGEDKTAAEVDVPADLECEAWEAARDGKPEVFRLGCERCRNCSVGRALDSGAEWAMAIPLRSGQRTTGLLVLTGAKRPAEDPTMVETYEGVGARLGELLEREQAQEEARRMVGGSPAVVYAVRVTPEGLKTTYVSANIERLSGYSQEEVMTDEGWWPKHVHEADRERAMRENRRLMDEAHLAHEYRFRHKDGHFMWVLDEKHVYRDEEGAPREVIGTWSDITRRVELERQLLHAQKMEAVGALAAGVAHDFNNLLTVINGYGELLQLTANLDEEARGYVEQVRKAGASAAELTRQLLAFSRKQELQPRAVKLAELMNPARKMLKRVLGEEVNLEVELRGEAVVMADPGQLEQVVMNLVVNARDAMPRGGRLLIRTADVRLEEGEKGVPAGEYAVLTVRDTGEGMEEGVRQHIFEPFFTTKEVGKGTGLGLPLVYGIVTQSGGYITVESTVGEGTEFGVWLPVAESTGEDEGTALGGEMGGRETVLVVEDQESVREVVREALEWQGYRVIEARGAEEALVAAGREAKIDLLLTDVVMPRKSGVQLAEEFGAQWPGTRILFMTGYADERQASQTLPKGANVVQKPFTPQEVARAVRRALDGA